MARVARAGVEMKGREGGLLNRITVTQASTASGQDSGLTARTGQLPCSHTLAPYGFLLMVHLHPACPVLLIATMHNIIRQQIGSWSWTFPSLPVSPCVTFVFILKYSSHCRVGCGGVLCGVEGQCICQDSRDWRHGDRGGEESEWKWDKHRPGMDIDLWPDYYDCHCLSMPLYYGHGH